MTACTTAPTLECPLTIAELCDLAVDANLVPDDMFFSWQVFGQWQRDVCEHFGGFRDKQVLDIGCGPLRFGSYIVREIGTGHFWGVEPFQPYVAIGRRIAEKFGAAEKVTLIASDKLDLPPGVRIDFAMCHAVFTHMSYQQIMDCLERLAKVMKPGGRLVMTYNLSTNGQVMHRGRLYGEQMPLISAHLPSDKVFGDFCASHGGEFAPFTAIPHPGQTCGVITFS